MKWVRLPASLAISIASSLFLGLGIRAVEGFGLGLLASLFNVVGLWLGIRLFTAQSPKEGTGSAQSVLIVILCFLKMPAFIVAGFLAWRIGTPAPGTFLAGVGLVYFAMIWWTFKVR